MKRVLWLVGGVVALPLLYVVGVMIHGQATDWQPSGIWDVRVDPGTASAEALGDSLLTFVTWNVGYGGLGAEADFFLDAGGFLLDGGRHVHMPPEDVARYTAGIEQVLETTKTDFFLLQEVDSFSKRSYHELQWARFRKTQPSYAAAFAPNYISARVPIPVLQPWKIYGDVHSGLANLSIAQPQVAERHDLPGEFPFPDRMFQLDRCLLVERFRLASGQELTVVNLHLSAYDDGSVRRTELGYLGEFLRAEQAAGRLVVVGGDWNLMPPRFPYDHFMADPRRDFVQPSIPADFMPDDWTYVYDATEPTNRKTGDPYLKDSTFVTTIDFFLLSPGLRARRTRVLKQDFQWSDHQPVYVEVVVE